MTPEQREEFADILMSFRVSNTPAKGMEAALSDIDKLLAMPSRERDAGTAREGEDWRKLSVTAVAAENGSVGEYIAQLESSLRSISANADFLRKSVGACHMAISRDNLEELRKDKWDPIDLPPRLYKYIGTIMERSAPPPATPEIVAAPGMVERMQRAHNDTFSFALVTPGSTLNPDLAFKAMTAALPVAQKERDDQWEASIKTQYYSAECRNLGFPAYIQAIKDRLLAPAAQVDPRVEAVRKKINEFQSTTTAGVGLGDVMGDFIAQIVAVVDASRKGQQ